MAFYRFQFWEATHDFRTLEEAELILPLLYPGLYDRHGVNATRIESSDLRYLVKGCKGVYVIKVSRFFAKISSTMKSWTIGENNGS